MMMDFPALLAWPLAKAEALEQQRRASEASQRRLDDAAEDRAWWRQHRKAVAFDQHARSLVAERPGDVPEPKGRAKHDRAKRHRRP